jgi:hypothetical protein
MKSERMEIGLWNFQMFALFATDSNTEKVVLYERV